MTLQLITVGIQSSSSPPFLVMYVPVIHRDPQESRHVELLIHQAHSSAKNQTR